MPISGPNSDSYDNTQYCAKAFIDIRHRPGIATPPEEDRATATGDLHIKFREDRSSSSRDMLADRQRDTQTDKLIAILRSPTEAE